MNKLKSFFSNSLTELRIYFPDSINLRLWGKGGLYFLVLSALLIQFLTYSAVLFNTSESRPIVATVDDDTQEAIRLTENTYLLNDNGARAYGPTYYRVASMMRFFGANPFYSFELTKAEQKERASHFSLMIVNLLAIFAYSFLLASLIHPATYVRFLLTSGFVHLFLQNDLRSTLVFMGKPDHLLVLFTSLAFLQTWKWLQSFEDRSHLLKSAAAWALAATTKLSVLFFIPGFLVFWVGRKWPVVRWSFFYFVKWVLIFYFLIGFPQTWDVKDYLGYLIHQNSYTSLATWDFFTNRWVPLFINDLKNVFWALILLVPLFYFQPNGPSSAPRSETNKKIFTSNYFRILGFCLLSFIFIVHKKTTAPFEWYTFPLTNILLMSFVLVYQWILDRVFSFINSLRKPMTETRPLSQWIKRMSSVPARYLALLLLFPIWSGNYSAAFYSQFKTFQGCRPEARAFKKEVDARASTGAVILADSTAPYDHQYHDKNIFMTYEMKTSDLKKYNPRYLALKKAYYSIYMPKSEGGLEIPVTHITNLEDTRSFYRTFFNKTEGTDIFGQPWKLVYSDPCTFELWEKK